MIRELYLDQVMDRARGSFLVHEAAVKLPNGVRRRYNGNPVFVSPTMVEHGQEVPCPNAITYTILGARS